MNDVTSTGAPHMGGLLVIHVDGLNPRDMVRLTVTDSEASAAVNVTWLFDTAPLALAAFISKHPADDAWPEVGGGLRVVYTKERVVIYWRVYDHATNQIIELPLSLAGFRAFVNHACGPGGMLDSLPKKNRVGHWLTLMPGREWHVASAR